MKLHGWKTVSGFFFTVAIAAVGGTSTGAELGCSTTASGSSTSSSGGSSSGAPVPAGCQADDSLDCSGGGTGITCPSGTTPDETAGACSDPSDQGDGTDGFCCIDISDTGCSQDDTVTGCEYPSYGFSCTSGSPDPSTDDTSLNCSSPTSDPDGNDDYCCADTGSGSSSSGGDDSSFGAGCVADDSLDCSAGGTGISCPGGTTPDDSSGICSDPSSMSDGTDGFCCIPITDTGCSQDDSVTGCEYPSYGFSCTSGSPDPSTDDSSLNCSSPTSDPDGNDDYCCAPM